MRGASGAVRSIPVVHQAPMMHAAAVMMKQTAGVPVMERQRNVEMADQQRQKTPKKPTRKQNR